MPSPTTPCKYFAFISYSRKDSKAAAWLQKRLEWFRFPVKLVPQERRPPHGRYVRPIYRDKTNLEVTDEHYWTNIRRALEESRYLVVLCSPHSAGSVPVDREVAHFLETHGGDASLLVPVIVSGSITSRGTDAALCPALHALGHTLTDRNLPTMVPDIAMAEEDAWEQGFVSIISYLLRLERTALGDHIQRETKRQTRVLRRWLEVVGALTLVAAGAGVLAYANGIEAREQRGVAVEKRAEAERNAARAKEQEGVAVARGIEAERHAMRAKEQEGLAVAKGIEAEKNAAEARANAEESRANAAEASRNAAEAQRQAEAVRAQLREAARSDWVEAVKLLERDRQSEAFAHLARAHRYDPDFILPVSTAMLALQDWHVAQPAVTIQADSSYVPGLFFFNNDTEILTAGSEGLARRWSTNDGTLLAEFRVEEKDLSRAVLSPNGRELLTCGNGNHVAVWDIATGVCMLQFSDHIDEINDACFSPNGKHIVTGSADGTARLYLNRQPKGIELARRGEPGWVPNPTRSFMALPYVQGRVLLNGGPAVSRVVFSPDGKTIVTGDKKGSVKYWNAANGDFLRETGKQGAINSIEYSADGARVVTASTDMTAKVWNAKDARLITTLVGHEDVLIHASFLYGDSHYSVVTASGDNTVRVWDGETGQLGRTLTQHTDRVMGVIPSPDLSRVVLSYSMDGSAVLRDGFFYTKGLERRMVCEAHGAAISAGKFSRDGSRFVTAAGNGSVMLWQPTRSHFHTYERSALDLVQSMRGNMAFSLNQDGTLGLTAHSMGAMVIWETASGMIRHIVDMHQPGVWEKDGSEKLVVADWGTDGKQIMTFSNRNNLHLWDAVTGQHVRALLTGSPSIMSLAWSPDKKHILIAREGKSVATTDLLMLNLDDSPPSPYLEGHRDPVTMLAFSRDSGVFASAHRDALARNQGSIIVWDAVTRKPLWTLSNAGAAITHLEFDRQRRRLLAVADNDEIYVWDMTTGEQTAEFKSDEPVMTAEFSADGAHLLIVCETSARVMDFASKAVVASLRADQLLLKQARYSRDGKFIVTVGEDRSVRLWDAATGLQAGCFGEPGMDPFSFTFSESGARLMIAHINGIGRVWDMPLLPEVLPPWWPSFLECMAGRGFTATGALEVLTQASLAKLRAEVLAAIGADASRLAQLARWHLSTHAERTVRPGDERPLNQVFDALISSTVEQNILLIGEIQPRHPLALIALSSGLISRNGDNKFQDNMRRAVVEFSVRNLPPDEPTCRRASELLKKFGYADLARQALAKSSAAASSIPVGEETLPKKAEPVEQPARSQPLKLENGPPKVSDSFVPIPLTQPMSPDAPEKPALPPVPEVPSANDKPDAPGKQ